MTISAHIHTCVTAFSPLAFPKEFGLEPLTDHDFKTYLSTPEQFEFSLKKLKAKNILYSQAHIKARQDFFNGLPQALRLETLTQKLRAQGLIQCFETQEIQDCKDIGAGHSVYLVTLNSPFKGHTQWVIKQEELPNQSLMGDLLRTLGWPSYLSFHHESETFSCEISQYLGHISLWEGLQTATPTQKEKLEHQLAQHAALGDILGRGDRHINNYMINQDVELLPIDISFLFWQGNEDWDRHYIAGGLYEFSMLAYEPLDTQPKKIEAFFKTYHDTLLELKANQTMLEKQLLTFCAQFNMESADKLDFIQARLNQIPTYFEAQKTLYLEALQDMKTRLILKGKLEKAIQTTPEILDQNPLLKMYALADHNQPSCFFLLEKYPQIKALLA